MASSFDRLEELNLTRDEVNRIGEALKNQEFRKLLVDYVEEIQDPTNRQIYEDEVKQIERERGQEVTFLHPTAGYVIKTSVNGSRKGFINICSNENVNKPSSSPSVKDGAKGLQWSLPHSLTPPHEDIDNKGVRCQVFDILFHPDTLHLASKNSDFRSMVNNVALDAIENNFNINLDKKNLKFPKLSYKGMKRASLLRKPSQDNPIERSSEEQEIFNKIYAEIDSKRNLNKSPKKTRTKGNSTEDNSSYYTTPNYVIKHRTHVDIQECTEDKNSKLNATVPKELIVEINLPLLKSSSDMDLDVTEKTIQLVNEKPAKYKLNLTLPYQVNEANGTAKFDKDLKKLVITLPVKRKNVFESVKDDSGVESCIESDLNSPYGLESDEEEPDFCTKVTEDQKPDETKRDCSDVRTETSDDFLKDSDLYNLPEFTCNVFDNIIAFTFHVKNVDQTTVCKQYSFEDSLIKVKFTSVSPSFYPSSYAFYVKFPLHHIIEDQVTVETWDNNVILQIPLKGSDNQLVSFLYGMNQDNLIEKFIEEPAIISKVLQQNEHHIDETKLEVIEKETKNFDFSYKSEVKLKNEREDQRQEVMEQDEYFEELKILKPKSNAIDIFATSYESSGDELSASSFSPRKSKGILKRMSNSRSKFGRSISESSLDEFFCSSFENYHGSIECVPEDSREDDGMSSSLKKTVRFNDVVTKQLFR